MTNKTLSDVLDLLQSKDASVTLSKAGMATLAFVAVELIKRGRKVVWLTRDREESKAAGAAISLLTPESSDEGVHNESESVACFGDDWLAFPCGNAKSPGGVMWAHRIAALHALENGMETIGKDGLPLTTEVRGVILPAEAMILRLPPREFLHTRELTVGMGDEIPPRELTEQLTQWGYGHVPMVANPGEFSLRGDILDILPPGATHPVRLDFFGDTIDEIRIFDVGTQRSLRTLRRTTLLPVLPYGTDAASVKAIQSYWKRLVEAGGLSENEHTGLRHLLDAGTARLLPGCAHCRPTVIEEWLPKDAVWLLPSPDERENALAAVHSAWEDALRGAEYRGIPARLCLREQTGMEAVWNLNPHMETQGLRIGVEDTCVAFPEYPVNSFQALFPKAEQQDRPWQALVQQIEVWKREQKTVILSFSTSKNRDRFLALAAQDDISPRLRYQPDHAGLYALIGEFKGGRDIKWANTLILGEDVIQPNGKKTHRAPTGVFKGLDQYDTLDTDEILVHRDYGIARFGGLVKLGAGNVANDYLLLHYAGDDKLYVPVDRIALVQRYKGGSEARPVLDRLGSVGWKVGKEKARKAIEKIAADLIEMYAWRKVAKGFRYPPVGELYHEFEASFGFEETPDQARAIADMLADMERPEPMDRLICGDVGFGKTEVALRAAFRAASEGRQVVLLCPTTVLAEQHYQTFRARLSPFAVTVGLLSRFVSAAKQKEVAKAAKEGRLDILIGTHRLLSKDVHLPNLGLFILDEEQRFGVRHKERIKQLRKNVDALTLTATPIPRTLQLSISGVRDLSVIETAPPERKPVATALIGRSDKDLRDILRRELAREGQIFWVHNRVQGLASVAEYAASLVPEARIGMAHGQMAEGDLESTMRKFWHGELDVLVCTAIVESGLDFPMANTLIVDQPQLFGLGQLYQLRGRVGRSDRQAYAVFVVDDPAKLPKPIAERLRVILDMDYLGAGFQVAMEDLRLRGAGNILGEAQSGHMGRVGIELYLEMLEEAVQKLKGEGGLLVAETEINLGLNAHIPEDYVTDGTERLRWYKRLSAAPDASSRRELEMEMIDRYGRMPEILTTFIAMLDLKAFLTGTKAVHADLFEDRVRVTWNETQKDFPVDALLTFLKENASRARFMPPSTLECRLDASLPMTERLHEIRRAMSCLGPRIDAETRT